MKNFIQIVLFLLCYSNLSWATSFEATVNTNNISLAQTIKLKLSLRSAKTNGEPELTGLNQYFTILSKQKFQNFSSINGKISNEEGWQLTIKPKMAGELIIPVIAIKTDKGIQYTQAINIYVDANTDVQSLDLPVTITAKVEKATVFVQEAFIYKITINTQTTIANPILDKLEINNCIIEELAEPKYSKTIVNGKLAQTTEIKYLITPLKSGVLTIPAINLKGEIETEQIAGGKMFDPFDNFNMFGNFPQLREYEPFLLSTNAIKIQVKPALPGINPWLALYELQAEESWQEHDTAKVGEPIIRNITLSALGATGSQLPSLKQLQEIPEINLYVDSPELTTALNVAANTVQGKRKEQFTIIPKVAGIITIPEIKINWWNLAKSQQETTILPSKTINVIDNFADKNLPKKQNNKNIGHSKIANNNDKANLLTKDFVNKQNEQQANSQIKILYIIIASLLLIILIITLLFIYFYCKKNNGKHNKKITSSHLQADNIIAGNNKEIKFIHDLVSLKDFIINYANKYWDCPANIQLIQLPELLAKQSYKFNEELANNLFTSLEQALYAGKAMSLEELKKLWQDFNKTVLLEKQNKTKTGGRYKELENLNPT